MAEKDDIDRSHPVYNQTQPVSAGTGRRSSRNEGIRYRYVRMLEGILK